MNQEKKFYEKSWFIILMLIFIAPIGIILIDFKTKLPKVAKIIISIVFSIWTLLGLCFYYGVFTTPSQQSNTPSKVVVSANKNNNIKVTPQPTNDNTKATGDSTKVDTDKNKVASKPKPTQSAPVSSPKVQQSQPADTNVAKPQQVQAVQTTKPQAVTAVAKQPVQQVKETPVNNVQNNTQETSNNNNTTNNNNSNNNVTNNNQNASNNNTSSFTANGIVKKLGTGYYHARLHSGPSSSSSGYDLSAGTPVLILGESNEFYNVQLSNGATGYIYAPYVIRTN